MANIKSNIKTKKQSDKRHAANRVALSNLKDDTKKAKANKDAKSISQLYSRADSLSRKHIIHRNKANRIKSRNAKAANKKGK
ncbi:MAG: 30S ribosomal protein S20 [Mycoplasmoidaceae bacterium]|nr:30S ribosomal protein S20 [Mycoplasmoidaceae bacterium]